jgi:hypothetical protein
MLAVWDKPFAEPGAIGSVSKRHTIFVPLGNCIAPSGRLGV